MVEEQTEVVYDIGYSYGNPCRYLQQAFRSFLKCLGLESQGEGEGKEKGDGNGGGSSSGVGGEVVDDPPSGDPSTMDPTDEPAISTRIARRRPPPRPPITSGGPGQTN